MARVCDQPLKQSPFTTYRDPKTGRWIVEKTAAPQAGDR